MYSNDIQFARTLRFLRSTSNPSIVKLLAARGFTKEDASEGWALFHDACGMKLSISNDYLPENADSEVFERLNKWENTWFPVADAALKYYYQPVREALFRGIERLEGDKVVGTIKVFIERIDELKKSEDPNIKAAMARLSKVGLKESIIEAARADIELVTSGDLVPEDQIEEKDICLENEKKAMWEWFQSWAALARTLDISRRLKVKMGLSLPKYTTKKPTEELQAEDLQEEEDTPMVEIQ